MYMSGSHGGLPTALRGSGDLLYQFGQGTLVANAVFRQGLFDEFERARNAGELPELADIAVAPFQAPAAPPGG